MRIPVIEPYKETAEEEVIFVPAMELERQPIILTTDKAKDKFIKYCEKLIRGSYEYKEYISYLRTVGEMNVCSVFPNVSKLLLKKLSLEIHHEPFPLYDIVNIVLKRFLNQEKELNEYDIVDEVLDLHFRGMVGLLPLSATVHELVHVGKVFLPLQYLDNGFMSFYNEYKEEVAQCDLEAVLEKKLALSKTFNLKSNSILHKKFIYVTEEGYNQIPEMFKIAA